MEDVLRRADESGFEAVRLVQTPFNNLTMSLYSKLGFDVKEPLSVMHGDTLRSSIPGYEVRRKYSERSHRLVSTIVTK